MCPAPDGELGLSTDVEAHLSHQWADEHLGSDRHHCIAIHLAHLHGQECSLVALPQLSTSA